MLDNKKTYYSISEVCATTSLEPHVLRYWESEFAQLRPKKNRAGNRAYREKDIDVVRYIKYLLYEEQYTIPGAKKKLSETKEFDIPNQMQLALGPPAAPAAQMPSNDGAMIREVSQELRDVLKILTA
jgi:DNA-binding transcriptional MerR regulator